MMIQIAEDRWLNPRYIVGAVLGDDSGRSLTTPERVLTLTLDGSTGIPDQYVDVTGRWIERVMLALDMFDPLDDHDKAAVMVKLANERHAAKLAGKVAK